MEMRNSKHFRPAGAGTQLYDSNDQDSSFARSQRQHETQPSDTLSSTGDHVSHSSRAENWEAGRMNHVCELKKELTPRDVTPPAPPPLPPQGFFSVQAMKTVSGTFSYTSGDLASSEVLKKDTQQRETTVRKAEPIMYETSSRQAEMREFTGQPRRTIEEEEEKEEEEDPLISARQTIGKVQNLLSKLNEQQGPRTEISEVQALAEKIKRLRNFDPLRDIELQSQKQRDCSQSQRYSDEEKAMTRVERRRGRSASNASDASEESYDSLTSAESGGALPTERAARQVQSNGRGKSSRSGQYRRRRALSSDVEDDDGRGRTQPVSQRQSRRHEQQRSRRRFPSSDCSRDMERSSDEEIQRQRRHTSSKYSRRQETPRFKKHENIDYESTSSLEAVPVDRQYHEKTERRPDHSDRLRRRRLLHEDDVHAEDSEVDEFAIEDYDPTLFQVEVPLMAEAGIRQQRSARKQSLRKLDGVCVVNYIGAVPLNTQPSHHHGSHGGVRSSTLLKVNQLVQRSKPFFSQLRQVFGIDRRGEEEKVFFYRGSYLDEQFLDSTGKWVASLDRNGSFIQSRGSDRQGTMTWSSQADCSLS